MRLFDANCQPQNYGNYGNFCRFFFLNPFFGLQILIIDVNGVRIAKSKIMIILPVRLHDGN